jgi:hypothetical protein
MCKHYVNMNRLGNGNSSYDGMHDYATKVSKIEALKKALKQ